jgi:hypothetical protein
MRIREIASYGNTAYLFLHDAHQVETEIVTEEIPNFYYNPATDHWGTEIRKGVKLDRANPIQRFCRSHDLHPYYSLLEGDDTDEIDYIPPEITLYFDIETLPDDDLNFADYTNSEVTVICCLVGNEKFALTTKNASYIDGVTTFQYKDEEQLIRAFCAFWAHYQPTQLIHYNGYNYDIPFLIHRAELYNIVMDFGLIADLKPLIRYIRVQGEKKPTWHMPGVRNIDLRFFFTNFYPHFTGFSLNVVAGHWAAKKDDLPILEMFQMFRQNVDCKVAIEYCIQDCVLLKQLVEDLDILGKLIVACNACNLTIEQFLTMSEKKICSAYLYARENNAIFTKDFQAKPPMSWKRGIYRDLELRRTAHFPDLPPTIAGTLSSSNYYSLRQEGLLTIKGIVYTLPSSDVKEGELLEIQDYRFVVDPKNYTIYQNNKYYHHNIRYVCKLLIEYAEAYYNNIRANTQSWLEPTIREEDIPLLAIAVKLQAADTSELKVILRHQLAAIPITAVYTSYYLTYTGPKLVAISTEIDVLRYRQMMLQVAEEIQKLRV